MDKPSPGVWVGVLLALVVGGYAAYQFLRPTGPPAPIAQARLETPASAPVPPASAPEPQIRHPLQDAAASAAAASAAGAPLPPLAEADPLVEASLVELLGRRAVLQSLLTDGFVRRIVATVDNLPGKHASPRLWPVHPMRGRFTTRTQGERLLVDPDNAQRYLPLVELVEAVDPARAAALYRRLYPLFQQAYEDLGYPKRYFNDRLVEVIDHLLATPQVEGAIEISPTVVRGPYPSATPWLHQEFADPALQSLSAGQRALLRSGVVNQRRLLAWLTALRAQIAR